MTMEPPVVSRTPKVSPDGDVTDAPTGSGYGRPLLKSLALQWSLG
jgi:hypothetical protein